MFFQGASIADQSVTIELAPNYTPPAAPHAVSFFSFYLIGTKKAFPLI